MYVVPHSQKNGSYQQIQSPNIFASPDSGPHIVNYHATRPPPLLPVGSQVEKDHDKLTPG